MIQIISLLKKKTMEDVPPEKRPVFFYAKKCIVMSFPEELPGHIFCCLKDPKKDICQAFPPVREFLMKELHYQSQVHFVNMSGSRYLRFLRKHHMEDNEWSQAMYILTQGSMSLVQDWREITDRTFLVSGAIAFRTTFSQEELQQKEIRREHTLPPIVTAKLTANLNHIYGEGAAFVSRQVVPVSDFIADNENFATDGENWFSGYGRGYRGQYQTQTFRRNPETGEFSDLCCVPVTIRVPLEQTYRVNDIISTPQFPSYEENRWKEIHAVLKEELPVKNTINYIVTRGTCPR